MNYRGILGLVNSLFKRRPEVAGVFTWITRKSCSRESPKVRPQVDPLNRDIRVVVSLYVYGSSVRAERPLT